MPILQCYVDDRTMKILDQAAAQKGRTVEELAEAAIENEANASLPSRQPTGQFNLPLVNKTPDQNDISSQMCCGEYVAGARCPACPERISFSS